jgi:hypothetical protein
MDLFDPKPMLAKYDGQKFPGEIKYAISPEASAKVLGSPWKFHRTVMWHGVERTHPAPRGDRGRDHLIRSMHSGVNNHARRSMP